MADDIEIPDVVIAALRARHDLDEAPRRGGP
jgi:hypothetical protein